MAPLRKTGERGLGWEHQQARAALPAPAGEPCPYCGHPMLPGQELDADHRVPRALGGERLGLRWAHRVCNRRAGARLGNRLRVRRRPRPWSEGWS